MSNERIVLYAAKLCPFAHRVEIALKESGIDYERCEIDFFTKPDWYLEKVNPAGKVPVIAYGGPQTPHDDPSPESIKIAESLVLVEFVNDLSGGKLLPTDPVLRAKARLFIETISPKVISAFFGPCLRGDDPQMVVQAIELLQNLVPEGDGFAVGDWSIADAAVVTLLARTELAFENDYGSYDQGMGKKAWDEVMNDAKFERFRRYYAAVKARKSFQESFARDFIFNYFQSKYPGLRAQRIAAKASQ
ncbi:hypothetical protein AGABI2DRAFT_194394 [Agaricus bisporus var. bisporus H97]|uniref:hypothetical protein n=1 Tax=Agaricus bisporus var. bisporus (strain H97 / ATCC MYA-4626 / FGSC 10389) TaxID=936046 RepID=UPI00029F69CA|nr:hypothetical protein AGABI2DRAFT_194394 [Agaricus bisporus var. bisporus H97]EKV44301.1 hypothetical protein AGABI2DRAFT_194394 [Agaricus bisporus var. bisporus H97]